MKEELDLKVLANQLAQPTGEFGMKVAENMNISNGDMTRFAIDLIHCEAGSRVLEIGPGNGRFADYVLTKANNIQYNGVDISQTMVDAAKEINKPHVEAGRAIFQQVDGLQLPFLNDNFDQIFTVNTLYFWKNPADQLAEIRRVLKPNGIFCLAIASKNFMTKLPFTGYGFILYSPMEAQELLLSNDFNPLDIIVRNHRTIGASQEEVIREEVFLLAQPKRVK